MSKTERAVAIFMIFFVLVLGLSSALRSPKDSNLTVHRPEPGLVCVTAKVMYSISISCTKEGK